MEVALPLERVAKIANVDAVEQVEVIQSLWSGYGQIVRVRLQPAGPDQTGANTVIVKYVDPPESRGHKYGWSGNVSHQRKLSSYDNETNWYQNASQLCGDACRVPRLIGAESNGKDESPSWLLVLEDLDAAGFQLRRRSLSDAQLDRCLDWLAHFHATFLFDTTDTNEKSPSERYQLWPIGTYWHLKTRPDELG